MKSDSIRGLYYKLSLRNNVWPKFSKYPFEYFFNNGIAIILLNSNCIEVGNDNKEIQKDKHFINLIYRAESRAVEIIFNRLKGDVGNSIVKELNQFFMANFNINLSDVTLWQITDIVDLWLFNHARSYCLTDSQKDECSLKQSGSCYCGDDVPVWKLNQSKDIIKAGV